MTNWERKKINHGYIWTWNAGLGFLLTKATGEGWDISEGGEYIASTRYPETAKQLCQQMIASRILPDLVAAIEGVLASTCTGNEKQKRTALVNARIALEKGKEMEEIT